MRADTDAHPEPRAWYLITLRAAGENVETMNLSLWQLHTSYIVGRASSEPPLSWTRGQSISEAMALADPDVNGECGEGCSHGGRGNQEKGAYRWRRGQARAGTLFWGSDSRRPCRYTASAHTMRLPTR
jgi:hypothetical protein